jgi:hypothetical protein
MKINSNRKQILRGVDDFNCVIEIFGHNYLWYEPDDFYSAIFYIYTTDKNVFIECTQQNGKLTVSENGQYYIQINADELEIFDFGQIRYKFKYELIHNKQTNNMLEGVDFGGVDTYLVSEITNN